jgi:hypothetical protein
MDPQYLTHEKTKNLILYNNRPNGARKNMEELAIIKIYSIY